MTGAQIREIREKLGWSQEELAYRASTTTSTISRVERGISKPRKILLRVIREVFEPYRYRIAMELKRLEREDIP